MTSGVGRCLAARQGVVEVILRVSSQEVAHNVDAGDAFARRINDLPSDDGLCVLVGTRRSVALCSRTGGPMKDAEAQCGACEDPNSPRSRVGIFRIMNSVPYHRRAPWVGIAWTVSAIYMRSTPDDVA